MEHVTRDHMHRVVTRDTWRLFDRAFDPIVGIGAAKHEIDGTRLRRGYWLIDIDKMIPK